MSDRDITDTPVTLVGTYRSRPRKALRLRPIDESFSRGSRNWSQVGFDKLLDTQEIYDASREVSLSRHVVVHAEA